ncbi:hypothetical protein A2335_01585 [Candidatus Peregrinibacteria bacterium RIFOXYB2_FULL_32_7]|nr:MAG: hypothetical protein A2335_01585 [Candidatus Peregrinibacteria bacterium RIFOXYB2_FULL_32_7]
MKIKRNFIAQGRNTGFICKNCSFENVPLKGGLRNHCVKCLYSLHVDDEVPGDRLSKCEGLMKVKNLDYSGKKGYILVHECQKCGKIMRNKMAKDDDQEILLARTSGWNFKF